MYLCRKTRPEKLQGKAFNFRPIRKWWKNGSLVPYLREPLEKVNFVKYCLDYKWDLNVKALAEYKDIYGHLLIPKEFIVPSCDPRWPQYLAGKKLGVIVDNIRGKYEDMSSTRKRQLDDLGFDWDPLESQWQWKLEALETYKQLYGDILVPHKFQVPSGNPKWPKGTWKLKLGLAVSSIRSRRNELPWERYDELNKLGFDWDPLESQWQLKMLAFETFRRIYGHLLVPRKFQVPENCLEWPKDVWGLNLGLAVTNIRCRRNELSWERCEDLEKLGIDWEPLESQWQLKIIALRIYKEIYGDIHVLSKFQVPKNDFKWPQETWELKLGQFVSDIRSRRDELTLMRCQELEKLGIVLNVREKRM